MSSVLDISLSVFCDFPVSSTHSSEADRHDNCISASWTHSKCNNHYSECLYCEIQAATQWCPWGLTLAVNSFSSGFCSFACLLSVDGRSLHRPGIVQGSCSREVGDAQQVIPWKCMCCQWKLSKVKASVTSNCSVNVHLLSWFGHVISLLEAETVQCYHLWVIFLKVLWD